MKKKIITAFAASAVLLTAGCGNNTPATTTAAPAETTTAKAAETTTTAEQTEETEEDAVEDPDDEQEHKNIKGLYMQVNGSDGNMTISRAPKKTTPMGDEDTWTVFVYLCGTDLESGQYSATGDLFQMAQAQSNENVKFVIQTGGTAQWYENIIDASKGDRYIIQDNDLVKVDEQPLRDMGDPDTLVNFLEWGVQEYPAEKMGLVFWDHGGGSITGACFDELNNDNSLSLSEINTALSQVYENMTDKFEFIGFDCCLMGTAETANILATYGRYFYGSQETEPGTGWDYTAIGNFLAENTSADGAALGKVLADSFYDECAAGGEENGATFTIIDLEKFDDFTVAFNSYAKDLYDAAAADNLAGIVRGVNNAENFGGNNKSEGYTNMVDIGGIVKNCSDYADGSAAIEALDNCIAYKKNGRDHKNASGLSIYYPLEVGGSEELKTFSGICISPYYLSLVDMVATGYTGNGYDNQVFFTEDGDWQCEDCSGGEYDDSYFDHVGEGGSTESQLIKFEIEPAQFEDGTFGFKLTEDSLNYVAEVNAALYYVIDDDQAIEIGETYDIYADWEEGIFLDNFNGKWLSLPDGQTLATYVVGIDDDCAVYTSPILLNGKETNLRIRVDADGKTAIDGAWDGINDNGIPAKEIKKLKTGDVIVPLYYLDTENDDMFSGDEYNFTEGDSIIYDFLPEGEYEYSFDIQDVYGDFYFTDYTNFGVENGEVVFYTE